MPSASVITATAVKPGVAAEGADAVAQIAETLLDPHERAGVAVQFLGDLDAAQGAAGGHPGIAGRQAAALVFLLQKVEVRRDLPREIALRGWAAEKVGQPGEEAAHDVKLLRRAAYPPGRTGAASAGSLWPAPSPQTG